MAGYSEPLAGIPYDRLQAGDIVVPADDLHYAFNVKGFSDEQATFRDNLRRREVDYAIYSDSTFIDLGPDTDWLYIKYQGEIGFWQSHDVAQIDESWLEPIFTGDDPQEAKRYITALTLYGLFDKIFGDTAGSAIKAGQMHTRLARICNHRTERKYLLHDSVYIGTSQKSRGDRWDYPQWGITPAALCGISLEHGSKRPFGLGKAGRENAGKILGQIINGQDD